jgi:hypothetical protein
MKKRKYVKAVQHTIQPMANKHPKGVVKTPPGWGARK